MAKIAITVFPLITLGTLIGGLLSPAQTASLVKGVNYALMVIMFDMGLTFAPPDFDVIARHPWLVLVDALAQYIVMPLAALVVTWAFRLDPALAISVTLVGYTPGGTTLNAVAYLAKDDVAFSVVMTTVSTLLSSLVTPILTGYLAGQYMPIDAIAMAKSIMVIVFTPVILGLLLRSFLPELVEVILPALLWISVFGIFYTVIALVGVSSTRVPSASLAVLAVVIVHNGLDLVLGYFAAKDLKVGEETARITAIEVGIQSSGLAATLGAIYFALKAMVPDAVFSV